MSELAKKTPPFVPSLRDLLLLCRAPLVFTAIADVFAGWVLASPKVAFVPERLGSLALAIGVTICCYFAGMILNDVFDLERDRELAPTRPMPAGRVAPAFALCLGLGLLFLGCIASAALGRGAEMAATGLALAVLSYDAVLKDFRVPGSLAMGLCRGLNVLFGAAAAGGAIAYSGELNAAQVLALVSTVWITLLTFLSTWEDEDAAPVVPIAGGIGLAVTAMWVGHSVGVRVRPPIFYFFPAALCTAALLGIILWRSMAALREGTKAAGKTTTRWLIRGVLLLDIIALLIAAQPLAAALVAALAPPYILGAKALFAPPPSRASK